MKYNTNFSAACRGDKTMGDYQGGEVQLSPLGEPGVHTPGEVKKLILKKSVLLAYFVLSLFVATTAPAVTTGTLEWALQKYQQYPELAWFLDKNVRITQENKSQSNTSWSMQIKGTLYPEFERTLLNLASLHWIYTGDTEAYNALIHPQSSKEKLKRNAFNKLHQFFRKNIGTQNEYRFIEKNLILGDMGKTPRARELFFPLKVTDEDQDQFLVHALSTNPNIFPVFKQANHREQMMFKKINGLIHLGHVCHLEGGPEMFNKIVASRILKHDMPSFAKEIITHICDVAGALAHVTNQGSLTLTDNTVKTLNLLIETLEVLKNTNPQIALKFYITNRSCWLGLNESRKETLVLTRLACMLRLSNKQDGTTLKNSWASISRLTQKKLIIKFNPYLKRSIQTPTYVPAVLLNIYNSSPDKRSAVIYILSDVLPFILRVIDGFAEDADNVTVLCFNKLAKQVKLDPAGLKSWTNYHIDQAGNVTADF